MSMSENEQDGLERIAFLIGKWTGEGEGFGQTSQVEHSYRYVLQNRFIESKTKSIVSDDDESILEVHEDLGMFSYDTEREAIVLRQFHSEGYVNVYTMDDPSEHAGGIVFTSDKTEGAGGLLARLRYDLESTGSYTVSLDLANPGQDFRECQVVRMRRVP
jgi:hypothetical protein